MSSKKVTTTQLWRKIEDAGKRGNSQRFLGFMNLVHKADRQVLEFMLFGVYGHFEARHEIQMIKKA